MTIQVSLTREIQGANVVYQFVADTIHKADEMARFLAGTTMQPLPAVDANQLVRIGETIAKEDAATAKDLNAKMVAAAETVTKPAKTEKEPEAKKPQLSGTASTPTSQPEPSATSKAYDYQEVKDLVVKVLAEKGRDTAAACLARVGLKVLPKDCKDAALLGSLGKLAEGVLAGTVDVFAAEEVEA